jgi:hypothetical protein
MASYIGDGRQILSSSRVIPLSRPHNGSCFAPRRIRAARARRARFVLCLARCDLAIKMMVKPHFLMIDYLEPWRIDPDGFPADGYSSDQLAFLLGYAILAPSLHNTQPWLFRVNAMDVELFLDRRRLLPVADPDGRQAIMSCGAVLCNLCIAAEYFGHTFKIETLPDPSNPQFMFRFHLGLQGETSGEDITLFHAISQRHTHRQPFHDTPVPTELTDEWTLMAQACGAWLVPCQDAASHQNLATLITEGDQRHWADKHYRAELAQWIRSKPSEHGDGLPPGVAGVGPNLAFASSFLVRTFNRGEGMAAGDREIVLHSPVLAVLGTDTDDPAAWIKAGQALQHVLLAACSEDVWGSFLSHITAIPDLRGRLAEAIGVSGYPQVLLRLGYGSAPCPTPRRPVRQLLLKQKPGHT